MEFVAVKSDFIIAVLLSFTPILCYTYTYSGQVDRGIYLENIFYLGGGGAVGIDCFMTFVLWSKTGIEQPYTSVIGVYMRLHPRT